MQLRNDVQAKHKAITNTNIEQQQQLIEKIKGIIKHYIFDYHISGHDTRSNHDKGRRFLYGCWTILPASVIFMVGLKMAAYKNNASLSISISIGRVDLLLSIALAGVGSVGVALAAGIKVKSNEVNQSEKHLEEINSLQAFSMKAKNDKFLQARNLVVGTGEGAKATIDELDAVKPAIELNLKPIVN